jgi:surface antigen
MTVWAFITAYLGQSNVGDTAANQGQCVGLVEKWLDANGKPHIWGNAKDLLANADRTSFTVVKNTPTNVPPMGAIICWDASWGDGDGHTAVVVAANVNRLAVFEQNDPEGAPCVVSTHSYAGIAGWITW